jgi:putative ABC transport system permease protein
MSSLAALLWRARWRQQPLQLAVTVLVVALGVALAYAVQLINGSALAEFGQAVRSVNGQPDAVLRGAASTGFDEQAFVRLAQRGEVLQASPVLELDTLAVDAQGRRVGMRVLGLDALRVWALAPDLLPRPAAGENRLASLDPQAVFLNPAARLALGRPQADGRPLALQQGDRLQDFRDAGDVAAAGPPLVVMDLAAAQAGFDRLGRLSRVDLRLAAGAVPQQLLEGLGNGLRLARPDEATERASQLSLSYRVNLTVLALVALFTGGFLVYSVQSLSVARQVPQLALLGVLGLDARGRRRLVLAEAAGLGVIGSVAGLLLGALLAQLALSRLGADLGSGQLGSGSRVLGEAPRLQWHAGTALLYGALGLLAACAGAWWPARTAERLLPAQALKGLGLGQVHRPSRWRGPVLVVLGIALAWLPPWHGLPLAAYASIAALLLGGLATIPALLQAVLARLPEVRAPVLHLALSRAREARHEAAASIAGVVASLALAVALTVMVGSFRASVTAWLDQLLPADLYVRSSRQASDAVWLPAALPATAAALPGVVRVQGQRVLSLPLDPLRPAPTLIVRPLPADVAAALPLVGALQKGDGRWPDAYASEALASLYGAVPGRPFTLTLPDGRRQTVWIAGLWRDYARQHGALMLAEADWLTLGGSTALNDLAIWLAPGTAPADIEQALRQHAGPQAALEFAASGEIRTQSLAIFDRSFAVTRWLQAVAIGIGLVGLASSLSGQVLARRKEFGTLQHLGLTRAQLRRLVVGEAVVWTGLGTLLGIALGLAVATVLIRVVNPQSFHWTMDMHVPLGALATLAAAVLLLAALTAAWSGRLAASRQLALSVKEET